MSDSQPRPEACDRCGRSKDDCRCRRGGGPKSLSQVQREITAWARSQFGDNVSRDDTSAAFGHPLGSLAPLLGMFEELGELAHAVVYRHQGRGYADPAEHREAKEDALADLMVFACDFAGREGIDLEAVLGEVWERVSKRRRDNWLADKRSEEAAAGGRAAALPPGSAAKVPETPAESGAFLMAFLDAEEKRYRDAGTYPQGNGIWPDLRAKLKATLRIAGVPETAGPAPAPPPAPERTPAAKAHPSHDWSGFRCLKCGAYRHLSSGFMECRPPAPKGRTVAEVMKARADAVGGGCCDRFADQQGCDCLENAVDYRPAARQDGHGFGHADAGGRGED
jgi:NTP pyrophosphatase (non-canonical NTP hydrolase)